MGTGSAQAPKFTLGASRALQGRGPIALRCCRAQFVAFAKRILKPTREPLPTHGAGRATGRGIGASVAPGGTYLLRGTGAPLP